VKERDHESVYTRREKSRCGTLSFRREGAKQKVPSETGLFTGKRRGRTVRRRCSTNSSRKWGTG